MADALISIIDRFCNVAIRFINATGLAWQSQILHEKQIS